MFTWYNKNRLALTRCVYTLFAIPATAYIETIWIKYALIQIKRMNACALHSKRHENPCWISGIADGPEALSNVHNACKCRG